LRVIALGRAAQLLSMTKRYEEAERVAKAYIEEVEGTGHEEAHKTRALAILAEVYLESEQYLRAEEQLAIVIEAYKKEGNALYLAAQHGNLAIVKQFLGKTEEALEQFQNAGKIYEHAGEKQALSTTKRLMGSAYERLGRGDEAQEAYMESLLLARAVASRELELHSTIAYAKLSLMRGEVRTACNYFAEIHKNLNNIPKERAFYAFLLEYALAAERRLEFRFASEAYKEIEKQCSEKLPEIYHAALFAKSSLMVQRLEFANAQNDAERALNYAIEASNVNLHFALKLQSAQRALEVGELMLCERVLAEAKELINESENVVFMAPIHILEGKIAFRQLKIQPALEYISKAISIYNDAADFTHSQLSTLLKQAVMFYDGCDISDYVVQLLAVLEFCESEQNETLSLAIKQFLVKYYLSIEKFELSSTYLKQIKAKLNPEFMPRELLWQRLVEAAITLARPVLELEEVEKMLDLCRADIDFCKEHRLGSSLVQCYELMSKLLAFSRDDLGATKFACKFNELSESLGLRLDWARVLYY